MTRKLGLIALLLALAMIAVACGGGSGDAATGVASLESQDAVAAGDLEATEDTEATTTSAELDSEAAMLAFTQCMRDEGVDMADPEVDADGNLRLGRPEGLQDGTIDPETARAARDACSAFLENVTQRFEDIDQTELQDQLLAYAQCVRDNGYEDIEDPDLSAFGPGRGGQGPGQGGGGPFGDIDRDDPAFQAADEACRDIFGDGFGPRLGPGGGGRGGGG